MARILIAYGTTDGQTRKIVTHIARRIRKDGHEALAFDTTAVPRSFEPARIDGFILAGSVHWGHYQRSLQEFVRDNIAVLRHAPSLMLSVSLMDHTGNVPPDSSAQNEVAAFVRQTGWTPDDVVAVEGAILYTQYGFFRRFVMAWLARRHGNPTDTTRDHEFTDWGALDRTVDYFIAQRLHL